MPHHRKRVKKHHHEEKVSPISIFNKVEVKISPRDSHIQTVKDQSHEDGVSGCFKSLFKCFSPG